MFEKFDLRILELNKKATDGKQSSSVQVVE